MFSLLILNKKTTESFNEYYPLFLDAIKKKNVAVCRWYESGSDIDSALPDLHDLTDDKKEWRAIIVKTEDDLDAFQFCDENPYDYTCNSESTSELQESPIPLIRLTHYLGGFPAPDIHFSPEEIQTEEEIKRIIYKPTRDVDHDEIFAQLANKYSFDGRAPSEIILITLRSKEKTDSVDNLRAAWNKQEEINSSYFWKRNNYPSQCRFVVFDLNQNGPIQREADMFSFWTCISLLATNDINPNYLQAYRLYRISVDFNEDSMQEIIQTTVVNLQGARHYIEHSIQQDYEEKLKDESEIPNYEVNVPVTIDAPKRKNIGINYKRFPITPSSDIEDNVLWSDMKMESFEMLDKCIGNSERALDESADSMRSAIEFPEELIKPLDKYQKKDMETKLSAVYSKIIMLFGLLPKTSVHYQEKLVDKENKIKAFLQKRIRSSLSVIIISLVTVLLLVGMIPAVYYYSQEGWGTVSGLAGVFVAGIALFGIIELIVLLFQKFKLNKKIKSYNKSLEDSVGELSHNAKLYSDFISSIATYTKGNSFLKKLSKKVFFTDTAYVLQKRHLKAIDVFLAKITRWAVAFHLDISFDVNDEVFYSINYYEKPQNNSVYTFISNQEKVIPVNRGGDSIYSSFDFIDRLNLEREELYDEYRN